MSDEEQETASVVCGTSKGEIEMFFTRSWSPNGYDKAVELFERGYFDNSHFFRVVPDFLVQFGIGYTDDENLSEFASETIPDDPQRSPTPVAFEKGTISYAGSGPNSRSSQLFFAYRGAESFGRELWETPVGQVVRGMENVMQFYSYGDMPPWGQGPVQQKIREGRSYIEDNFPLTDHFLGCKVTRSVDDSSDSSSEDDDEQITDVDAFEKQKKHHESVHHHHHAEPSSLGLIGNPLSLPMLGGVGLLLAVLFIMIKGGGKKASDKSL